ncbi:MAG: hypothetical protein KJO04_02725 [Bacteroidia bacterium]|nr:hypothetical protein [Bacteroidia bacterium]
MRTIKTILLSKIPYWAFSMLLVMACNPKETRTQEEQEREPSPEPKGIISEKEAGVLFDTYSRNRLPLIEKFENEAAEEGEENFMAARYTYFNFKEIQKYMKYIEEQAASAGKDIETLRIYYATYPAGSGNDSKKNTVFLVPTTKFGDVNKAFKIDTVNGKPVAEAIPWNFKGIGKESMEQEEKEGEKNQAGFFTGLATNTVLLRGGSLILNDGNTAPPPPNQ